MRPPRLILAAHGSADPRYSAVFDTLVTLVAGLRPDLEVSVGYLEHGPPDLRALDTAGAVVVPLLLATGFHVRSDVPAQAAGATITPPIAPDPRLTALLERRLREAGWDGETSVVLAAAGSKDPAGVDEVRAAAAALSRAVGAPVEAAFVSAGEPRLADLAPAAVATYLLAPGRFSDTVAECGASVVAEPLGAHPAIAQIAIDRYDATTVGD